MLFVRIRVGAARCFAELGLDACAGLRLRARQVLRVVHMGLNINSVNYDGQTVLHIMSKAGFKEGIEQLLGEGADVNIRDRWNRTAWQEAVDGKQHAVERLLSIALGRGQLARLVAVQEKARCNS